MLVDERAENLRAADVDTDGDPRAVAHARSIRRTPELRGGSAAGSELNGSSRGVVGRVRRGRRRHARRAARRAPPRSRRRRTSPRAPARAPRPRGARSPRAAPPGARRPARRACRAGRPPAGGSRLHGERPGPGPSRNGTAANGLVELVGTGSSRRVRDRRARRRGRGRRTGFVPASRDHASPSDLHELHLEPVAVEPGRRRPRAAAGCRAARPPGGAGPTATSSSPLRRPSSTSCFSVNGRCIESTSASPVGVDPERLDVR